MKKRSVALALLVASCATAGEPRMPLAPGEYAFQHKFAEHPSIPSITLKAIVKGHHITLINEKASDPFPAGIVAEGKIAWHAKSGQWVVIANESELSATDVGGCSDGPEVIDLKDKVYWTC